MKKFVATLLAVAMVLSMSACGSSSNDVLADGVLTVGTNAEFPPFEFIGDDGQPDGFDIALIKAVGEKLGVKVEVSNMEFASLVTSIGSKIDVAIAGMTVTEERKQAVEFSNPYYDAVQYVILPKDSAIKTADDLVGKTIGVQLGTTGDFIAQDIQDSTVSAYNKAVDAVNDLINGRVDVVIIDKNPALVFESKYSDSVVAVDGAQYGFEVEQYAIAMPKGNTELVEKVNKAIEELKADGTFDQLVEKYI
ncbi:MAG: basic amino acid ABC transporter substrate-binding protein [Lachnospiraceae bacterium]|nr:basic amino acid ABC transporter substrate-binding protein [Lachnospiraceae bacterium]